MHLPTLPRPATSTTFSCHESKTLIAAPLLSFAAPGLPPIWENPAPVLCGETVEPREGVRVEDAAIPLYLLETRDQRISKSRRPLRNSIS